MEEIEKASDLDEAVKDKRAEWRASRVKRGEERRYEKRLTKELLLKD